MSEGIKLIPKISEAIACSQDSNKIVPKIRIKKLGRYQTDKDRQTGRLDPQTGRHTGRQNGIYLQ